MNGQNDNDVKVDLVVDPAGLDKGYAEALAKQKKFNETFMQEDGRQHQVYVQRLKDQAATVGMTRTEVERFRAAQMELTAEQRKSVDASLATIDAHERQRASYERLISVAARASAAAAAVGVAVVAASIRQATQAERSEARFGAIYNATGGTSGFARDELDAMVDNMSRSTVHGDETIRDAMSRLMTYRAVSGETFRETMKMAVGLSEVFGGNLAAATETLGRALEDPVQGLIGLRRAGIAFRDVEKDMIKDLVEHGRQAEAVAIILQKLKDAGFDKVGDAVNTGYTKAFADFSKQIGETFEALGKMAVVKTPVTGTLDAISRSALNLRQVLENGTWWERLLVATGNNAILGLMRTPTEAAGDPNSPEAIRARQAAGDQAWQIGFDAQQANLRKFIDGVDKKDARSRTGEQWNSADLSRAHKDAADELKKIAAAQDEMSKAGVKRLHLQEQFEDQENRRFAQMEQEARQLAAMLDPWEAYSQKIEKLVRLQNNNMITPELFAAAQGKAAHELGEQLGWLGEKGTKAFDDLTRAVEGWGRDASREFARAAIAGKLSFDTLGLAAQRYAEELLAIQIQRNLMDPALKAGTSFLDNLFKGGPKPDAQSQTGPYGGMGDMSVVELHSGGLVGVNGRRRYVHPAYFEGAPRMHRGGLAGDEVPAILQKGERVLKRGDSGMNVRVQIINQSSAQVQGTAGAPQFDAEGAIVQVVLRDLHQGGPIRDAMQGLKG